MERGELGRQAGGGRGAARVDPGGDAGAVWGAAHGGGVRTALALVCGQELRQRAGVSAGEGGQSSRRLLGLLAYELPLLHVVHPRRIDV